ncbi:hypothetical protein HOP50_07g47920 [Chloropicon primus]|nr:hypothetical protein HOP50_07g47920 [Chloropicon primus]
MGAERKKSKRDKKKENPWLKNDVDPSVPSLKTENRERLFAFNLPQPPGDPKLLEVPVDSANAKMKFQPGVGKSIGHAGVGLLKTKHVHLGLQRRAELPAVNLGEGLKLLGMAPYNLAGQRELSPEDLGILDKQKPFLSGHGDDLQPNRSAAARLDQSISGKMSWVMNTTYISVMDRQKKKGAREGTTAMDRAEMEEGSSVDVIKKQFDSVQTAPKHPAKSGLKMVSSTPIVPYKRGDHNEYLELQVNDSDPYPTRGHVRSSILKQCTITTDDHAEPVEVSMLMLPEGSKGETEDGTQETYKLVSGFKYGLAPSRDRFMFMLSEDKVEYVDFSAKIFLSKLQTKNKEVTDVLSSVRKSSPVLKRKRQ